MTRTTPSEPSAAAADDAPVRDRPEGRELTSRRLRRDSEELYRAIFENAAVGIRVADTQGVMLQANGVFHRLLGYGDGELLGRNVLDITHPDDRAESSRLAARVITGEQPSFSMEKRYLRADGGIFWGRLTSSPMRDEAGQVVFLIGLLEDITDRRRAEQQLEAQAAELERATARTRAIIDKAVDGILTIDERGSIESLNPAAERMFGYRADEVIGKNVKVLMPSPYREEHDDYLEAYKRTGHRKIIGIGREVVAQRKDGSVFPIDLAVSEVPLGKQRIFVGTIKDITVRKGLEEQLRHALKMEAIGRLAGGVAHDFNNLLASITGYSEMLADRLEDGPLRQAAYQIRRSAERGAGLTRQLLAFSRRQELALERVDLSAVIGDLQDMLERLLGERVRLEYRLQRDGWPVLADRGQLEQVVLNLVVNARDALEQGAAPEAEGDGPGDAYGRIVLATENVELDEELLRLGGVVPAGRWVRLVVEDNGCGMSEALLSRIFEPFFTTKEPGKGTGLGLSTVYGIVRQSGGNLLVQSAPGVGTSFEIYLPRADGRLETERQAELDEPAQAGGESVLLVEDDDTLRELLADVLAGAGYRVTIAAAPRTALELAAQLGGDLDLLVSDLVMPGMKGSELARQLKAAHPDIAVVLMSGYSEVDEGAAAAGELGALFLQKPFGTKELLRALRRLLDTRPRG